MKRKEILDIAEEIGVTIMRARSSSDKERIGIHLFHPTKREVMDALETAERDNFPTIIIHDYVTPPKPKRGDVLSVNENVITVCFK